MFQPKCDRLVDELSFVDLTTTSDFAFLQCILVLAKGAKNQNIWIHFQNKNKMTNRYVFSMI